MQSYVLKLALLALSAGSALAVSGGACNKASQKNTGKGYWACTPAGRLEKNGVGLETRLRPRPLLNRNSLASLGLRPVIRGRIVAQMHRPLQRRFR
jgi:hypothetical protein